MTKVHLSQPEIDSAAWQKVEAVINARLADYRAKNENPFESDAIRLSLCWRIKELKELLKLAEPQSDAG